MAFSRVRGSGITTTDNYTVGVITATKFVGESGGSATFDNVSIGGSLTVNGDFTTLNTTLREVELLQVDANSSTTAGIITQRGSGDILNLFDTSTEVLTVKDGGNFGVGTINPLTKAVISNAGAEGLEVHHASGTVEVNAYNRSGGGSRSPFEITAQTFKLSTGNPSLSVGLCQDASGHISIGSNNVTDSNYLTINGSGASNNVGIVFNKTNSPARAHGIQVANTTGDLIFYDYTVSEERLRIDTGGGIGINESNPTGKLTITNTHQGFVDDSAQPQATFLIKHGTSGTDRRWIGIGASTTGAWLQSSSPGGSGLAAPFWINKGGGDIYMGSGGTRLFVKHSGEVVGINTTEKSIAGLSKYLSVSARNITNGAPAFELVGARTGGDQTVGAINFVNQTSNVAQIRAKYQGSTTQGSLHFFTSGAEALRITNDGYVAINSAGTATNLLDVRKDATNTKVHIGSINGTLASMPNSSEYGISIVGNNAEFQIHKDASGNYQLVLGTYQGSIDMPLVFRTDNRQERMRITKAGNVGINDSNPGAQLVVKATTDDNPAIQLYRQSTGGDIASINWKTGSGDQAKINYRGAAGASEGMQFYTAGGSSSELRMVIDHSGLVGINQSDPATVLDIKSTKASDGLTVTKGSNVAAFLGHNGTGDEGLLHLKDGGTPTIQIYGETGQVSFFNAGNVGINNSSPAEKLDVTGSVQASGGFKTAGHPVVTYASFTDISGGTYATRLGSTGSSTLRSTQIYGGGSHIATFDGVNKRLGINVTAPDSALELRSTAASYTPIIKLSNHNSGAWAGGIKFESNYNGTIYESSAIYGYGGAGSSDGILAIQTRGTERFRCNAKGQTVVTPSGNAGSASANASLSIVQTSNSNGTYAGISIKSIGGGGGNGMSIYSFDDDWDLYSRSGNQTGLGFLTDTSSNSSNARMVIGADGKVCLGTEVYGHLSTSRDSYTALHIAGGGLSIGPKGNNQATRDGGRYVLGWYMMSAYTGHSYIHVVTDLYGGSGNNYDYIMGGFHIHGHSYSSSGQSEERIYFHNWSGNLHGHSRGQWGAWDPGNNVYINSNGYVTIRLAAGAYRGYIIDLVQHAWYGVRNVNVTAHTGSNSSTI